VKLAPKQLYSDSIGASGSGADSYTKMMVANTQAITAALGGKVTPLVEKLTGILLNGSK
jgi:manganese/iron transport system substrate-binding protein